MPRHLALIVTLFVVTAALRVMASAEETEQPLGLPPPSADQPDEKRIPVDLSSGSATLTDELGPLVINSDGTTARITNWHSMTPDERERTVRIITERNRRRLKKLKEQQQQNEQDQEGQQRDEL